MSGTTLNATPFETSAGAVGVALGVDTVTVTVAIAAMSAAAICALSWVPLTKVVVRAAPFHSTVEFEPKLLPKTISVKAAPLTTAPIGDKELIVGFRLMTAGNRIGPMGLIGNCTSGWSPGASFFPALLSSGFLPFVTNLSPQGVLMTRTDCVASSTATTTAASAVFEGAYCITYHTRATALKLMIRLSAFPFPSEVAGILFPFPSVVVMKGAGLARAAACTCAGVMAGGVLTCVPTFGGGTGTIVMSICVAACAS